MKVYLVGPIRGISFAAGEDWRQYAEKRLTEHGHQVFTPLSGKSFLKKETVIQTTYEDRPISTAIAIFNRDKWFVKQSDALLANFTGTGQRASIGSVCELAWGHLWHKLIIIVLPEKYPDNIHDHPFLNQTGIVVPTLDEAINIINITKERNAK